MITYLVINKEWLRATAVERWYRDALGDLGGFGVIASIKSACDALGSKPSREQLEEAGIPSRWFLVKCGGCRQPFDHGVRFCQNNLYFPPEADICFSCLNQVFQDCQKQGSQNENQKSS